MAEWTTVVNETHVEVLCAAIEANAAAFHNTCMSLPPPAADGLVAWQRGAAESILSSHRGLLACGAASTAPSEMSQTRWWYGFFTMLEAMHRAETRRRGTPPSTAPNVPQNAATSTAVMLSSIRAAAGRVVAELTSAVQAFGLDELSTSSVEGDLHTSRAVSSSVSASPGSPDPRRPLDAAPHGPALVCRQHQLPFVLEGPVACCIPTFSSSCSAAATQSQSVPRSTSSVGLHEDGEACSDVRQDLHRSFVDVGTCRLQIVSGCPSDPSIEGGSYWYDDDVDEAAINDMFAAVS